MITTLKILCGATISTRAASSLLASKHAQGRCAIVSRKRRISDVKKMTAVCVGERMRWKEVVGDCGGTQS